MPLSRASWGDSNRTGSPSNEISPVSGGKTPVIALINVDLPAPLSPISATTSPERTSKSTSFKACTAPKDLLTPLVPSTTLPPEPSFPELSALTPLPFPIGTWAASSVAGASSRPGRPAPAVPSRTGFRRCTVARPSRRYSPRSPSPCRDIAYVQNRCQVELLVLSHQLSARR